MVKEAKQGKIIEVKPMNILVACEESQTITKELRALGHNAYSCDLKPCSSAIKGEEKPEWHFQIDVFEVVKAEGKLKTEGGNEVEIPKWDMMIAHPSCTYLAVSGARWLYNKDKSINKEREKERDKALEFVRDLWNVHIEKIVIENPVSVISTSNVTSDLGKPTQIVQPFMFGDEARKTTCLWLRGLNKLKPTDIVEPGERVVFKSGKSHPKWYSDALVKAKTPEERRTLRSKTFPGMAKAMALQWAGKVTTPNVIIEKESSK